MTRRVVLATHNEHKVKELREILVTLESEGKLLERQRLEERTGDLALIVQHDAAVTLDNTTDHVVPPSFFRAGRPF